MRNLITPLLIMLTVSGCATTRVTGYTDPAFIGRQFKSTAVFANTDRLEDAAQLEEVACRQFAAYGVPCQKMTDLFPPTRSHSTDEVYGVLAAKGVETVLMFTLRGDESESRVALVQTFSSDTATVNTYGGAAYGYGSGQSTSIPIEATRRISRSRAELFDCASRSVAWVGDADTKGKGRFGTSDSKFRASLAKGTVATLVRAGHFGRESPSK